MEAHQVCAVRIPADVDPRYQFVTVYGGAWEAAVPEYRVRAARARRRTFDSTTTIGAHAKELKKHMDLAVDILSKARDHTLAASREKFDANQTEVNFEPGERVRLWKRIVVRRNANASNLESSMISCLRYFQNYLGSTCTT